MKRMLFVLAMVLLASPALAQTVDRYVLTIYPVPAGPPPTTFTMMLPQIGCNQAPPLATATTVNPNTVAWTDEANAGRVCSWIDPGNGVLFSLPLGASYEGTLRKGNAAGNGPESTRAPFSRSLAVPTTAPTGVRLVRPS